MKADGFKDPDFTNGQWVQDKGGACLLIMKHTGWDGVGWPTYDVGGWKYGKWFEKKAHECNLVPIKNYDEVADQLRVPTWQDKLAWLEELYRNMLPYWALPLVEALNNAARRFHLTGESQFLLLKSPSNELGEWQIPLFVCDHADEKTKPQFNALWDAQAEKEMSKIAESMTKRHESNDTDWE